MRMSVRIVLAVVFVVALGVPVTLAVAMANDSSVSYKPIPARQFGVVWSDRVFLNRTIAANWLHARGKQYGSWAQLHPPAARRIAARSSP